MVALKSDDEKVICKAVIRNDEDEISRLLAIAPSLVQHGSNILASGGSGSRRVT